MKGRKGKRHAKAFSGKETLAEERAEERAVKKAHSVKGAMTKARLDKKARGGHVKKWEQGAVKHPGSFTRSAEHAGKGVHEYAEEKKHASGTLGKRARLALIFEKQAKKK